MIFPQFVVCMFFGGKRGSLLGRDHSTSRLGCISAGGDDSTWRTTGAVTAREADDRWPIRTTAGADLAETVRRPVRFVSDWGQADARLEVGAGQQSRKGKTSFWGDPC